MDTHAQRDERGKTALAGLPPHLVAAIQHAYKPAGIRVTSAPVREAESAEYDACRLGLDGDEVAFRTAKTTPTKIGQFVTLWKRPAPGEAIAPFDICDEIAFVIVSVGDATHCGQFVFSQELLVEQGVMSHGQTPGKRALRVYPPWTTPTSRMALRTQRWQLPCFVGMSQDGCPDEPGKVRQLFSP